MNTSGLPCQPVEVGAGAPLIGAPRTRIGSATSAVSRWAADPALTARRALPHLPVAFLIVAYAARFSLLSVSVFDGYGSPPYDMAIFDQGVWLLSRFHAPFVTVMGRNLFGDHTSFILLLCVPLYWVIPKAQVLLVLQACLLAGAAIPMYVLARKRIGGALLPTLLAAAYLLNPALQNGNLEQFHPEAFLVLAISLAIYAAVEWRTRLLVVAVVLSLLVKEDTAVLIVPLGVWVAIRRNRAWGVGIMVAGVAYAVFAYEVVIASLMGTTSFYANRIPFGGVGGTVKTTFRHPGRMSEYLTDDRRPWYVWQMGVSFGWVFLVAPDVAAIALLSVGENVISNFPYMHQILYHYSLPIVPVLALGTVMAVAALRTKRRQKVATVIVVSCALVSCILWGLAPFSRNTYPHWSPNSPEVHDINAVRAALPGSAVVSAYYPYVAHIDHRTRIYMWPTPFRAQYWALYTQEGQRLPFADQIQYVMLPTALSGTDLTVWNANKGQFRLVKEVGDVALYQRKSP